MRVEGADEEGGVQGEGELVERVEAVEGMEPEPVRGPLCSTIS